MMHETVYTVATVYGIGVRAETQVDMRVKANLEPEIQEEALVRPPAERAAGGCCQLSTQGH